MTAAAERSEVLQEVGARPVPLPIATILPGDEPSPRTDHVLVEVLPFGIVQASGAARTAHTPTYFRPARFPSLSQAIVAAHAWAQAHGIDRICLVNRSAVLSRMG